MSTPTFSEEDLKKQIEGLKKLVYTHKKAVDLLLMPIVRDAIETSEQGYKAIISADTLPSIETIEKAGLRMGTCIKAGERFLTRHREHSDKLKNFQEEKLEAQQALDTKTALKRVRDLQTEAIKLCQEFSAEIWKLLEEVDKEKAEALKESNVVAKAYFESKFESEKGYMCFVETWYLPPVGFMHNIVRAHRYLMKVHMMRVAVEKVALLTGMIGDLRKDLAIRQIDALKKLSGDYLVKKARWQKVIDILKFHEQGIVDFERDTLKNLPSFTGDAEKHWVGEKEAELLIRCRVGFGFILGAFHSVEPNAAIKVKNMPDIKAHMESDNIGAFNDHVRKIIAELDG
ncbi:hypothetical protein N0V83_000070 [Neocucurbitaria cava]|uniref:Uncharacterized protein n=1 Tax=Neocucurbitaria cava TaxID=798079 RepID=A0A9W8YG19_9PLEO|nr:hypothetical protein N0V83_000070 [Neocucurbitaria cava]